MSVAASRLPRLTFTGSGATVTLSWSVAAVWKPPPTSKSLTCLPAAVFPLHHRLRPLHSTACDADAKPIQTITRLTPKSPVPLPLLLRGGLLESLVSLSRATSCGFIRETRCRIASAPAGSSDCDQCARVLKVVLNRPVIVRSTSAWHWMRPDTWPSIWNEQFLPQRLTEGAVFVSCFDELGPLCLYMPCFVSRRSCPAPLSCPNGPGFRVFEVHPGAGGKAVSRSMNPTATGIIFTNTLQETPI